MTSVEQLIGDLLLKHNCVIVPTFGGFVANPSSAVIDYVSGTMIPPKKSLMFNRQLINNDGLLVSEFARQNNVSYADAQKHLLSNVNLWIETLRRGERIILDNIGQLYFDQERNIRFEQDRFFNLLLQSYGLGKVRFVSENEAEKVVATTVVGETETPIRTIDFNSVVQVPLQELEGNAATHTEHKKRSMAWRYVAAACFLPIAFYGYWIPVKTDVLESGMISIQDFNPFYQSSESRYEQNSLNIHDFPSQENSLDEAISSLPPDVKVYSYAFDEDTYIPVKIEDPSTYVESPVVKSETSPQVFNAGMHFVVGCFANEKNAQNLVSKLQENGMDASIIGTSKGLIRVSAGNALSEEAMQKIVTKANSLGFTGWVLRP